MITLEIPALPKRINQTSGVKWQVIHANRIKWRKLVGMALLGKKPNEPFKKATISLTRCSSAPPDFDGLVQSFKPVIDALVFHKVIEDDSMAHIGQPDYTWKRVPPGKGKIIIKIEGEE